jgi:dihydropyrimidine dehydrogenase (NAD+) subunit PreT
LPPTSSSPTIPAARAEAVFDDFKGPYTAGQALAEANRCLYCFDAPCIQACPTSIDIPEFIRKIATGNIKGSARTIFDSNILGMSCARVCPVEVLCVGDCVYNHMGIPPIQIGRLQRYSTDLAFEQDWKFHQAGPDTGCSVAVVGGGPASLAAAHMLRRLGHAVTLYEKRSVLGGLNSTGVAPYKLRADRSVQEVDWVLSIGGIDVRTGVEVGVSPTWAELEASHDAIFVGLGLGPDRSLPGAELAGVYGAVDWIELMKLQPMDLSGVKTAVVIGGGNTAVDCVRELLGLGVSSVTMLYRGTEDKMSGYAHEWTEAKDEGARVIWNASPGGFVGQDRVHAVRAVTPDGEIEVQADLVLIAIGQSKLGHLLAGLAGIEVHDGRIVVDDFGNTDRPGWFAGGDCANGGKEVVNAVAEGKAAALAIHAWLSESSNG